MRLAATLEVHGHDVTSINRDYAQGVSDVDVLALATREARVLVTFDRDFGELVVRHREPHAGVIYLRLGVVPLAAKAERLLESIDYLASQNRPPFLVVTPIAIRSAPE
ncbi:MAG: hypothetical protein EXR52_04630 [Dehalococcoidia bacterium]|nr:hypothetical protein [Dehalococcoidia bacterium]